jgi:hypothetical protein
MTPVITITDSLIPAFTGLTIDLPAIPTPGLIGGLVAKAASGKTLDAVLVVAESGDDLTESIEVASDIPFISNLLNREFSKTEVIPAFLAEGIRDLLPNGSGSLKATITL